MINQYQDVLENGSSLDSVINAEHADRHSIDASYQTIIKSLKDASEKCFPKSSFKRYLKPYWNDDLKSLHKYMVEKRICWICTGRPRGSNNVFIYKEYKDAKRLFWRVHRNIVDSYLLKVHEDAEVDSGMFWREDNKRRKKSNQNQA